MAEPLHPHSPSLPEGCVYICACNMTAHCPDTVRDYLQSNRLRTQMRAAVEESCVPFSSCILSHRRQGQHQANADDADIHDPIAHGYLISSANHIKYSPPAISRISIGAWGVSLRPIEIALPMHSPPSAPMSADNHLALTVHPLPARQ